MGALHYPIARRTGALAEPSAGRRAFMLRQEHLTACATADRLEGAARERFRALVGHVGQRLDVGGIGVAPIQTDPITRTWEPCESGDMALIVPARERPNHHDAAPFDLIAWVPRDGRMYSRLGLVDVLGWDHVAPMPDGDPVKVHHDPGAWCRAGGRGVVLFDLDRARHALDHVPALACDDLRLARQLDLALTPPPPRKPVVMVPRAEARP